MNVIEDFEPRLERVIEGSIAYWTDQRLAEAGIRIAFTERSGGVSQGPYGHLNLAGHVGDEPAAVNHNRERALGAVGLARYQRSLTTAEQVHGDHVVLVDKALAGAGARVGQEPAAVRGTDALVTTLVGVPLMLFFADCVPVTIAAPSHGEGDMPGVAVVHAGWKGALAGIPAATVKSLVAATGSPAPSMYAYIGPHIRACHYPVDENLMSQFVNSFGTVARAESGLDLESVVTASLSNAGVPSCRIASLGACTAEDTEHFYSYRGEAGLTGRHGALGCVLPQSSSLQPLR